MKIELLALLDLVQAFLKSPNTHLVHADQIQSQLAKFKDVQLVAEIIRLIEINRYEKVLDLISSYRVLCKELLPIYNSLTRDYQKLKDSHFKDDLAGILNEKYGISHIREVINLLEQKHYVQNKLLLHPIK